MGRKWKTKQLQEAVSRSHSFREVIIRLGLIPAGGNYATIQREIRKLNLDTSHFTGKGWNVGMKFVPRNPRPLSEILVEHSDFATTYHLKERLIQEKIKEAKCECCGLTEWRGYEIPLELHHINGTKDDLRIENLQLLCPNCHTLTDNYRGKKLRMSARKETSDVEAG